MAEVIGLLGGVASGKSTVSGLLARRGVIAIDADAEARAVTAQPAVREALARRFGADIVDAAGVLDRALLARRAFADARATEALNAIVHPAVRRRIEDALAAAGERPVVLDVPLLVDSPLARHVTTWVFVEADDARRDGRAEARGWTPGERRQREARQVDLDRKRGLARHVLENNGSIEDLERQVDALVEHLGLHPSEPGTRGSGP